MVLLLVTYVAGDRGPNVGEGGADGQAHGLPRVLEIIITIFAGVRRGAAKQIGPAWQLVFQPEESLYPAILVLHQGNLGWSECLICLVAGHLWTHQKTHKTLRRGVF